jgi:hypothetical protein
MVSVVIWTLNRPGWSAYLVGGTLRDLLVGPGGRYRFVVPRDVDIVVCGAAREELWDGDRTTRSCGAGWQPAAACQAAPDPCKQRAGAGSQPARRISFCPTDAAEDVTVFYEIQ